MDEQPVVKRRPKMVFDAFTIGGFIAAAAIVGILVTMGIRTMTHSRDSDANQ